MLWHQRLCHIGEKGLHALKKLILVDGVHDCAIELDFCGHCMYGKQNRVQFYSSSHKTSGWLDLIHFDAFGPIKVPSISKDLYYVSLIDDYSRRTWTCTLLQLKFRFLVSLRSLKLSWKIRLVGILRC
jgi:hypothetical protein